MATFEQLTASALADHKAGHLAQAEVAYRAALVHSPGHPAVTHNLGLVAAARGDHGAALAMLDQVIAAEPAYVSAHYNRGVALERLGRPREALDAFRRAVALEPGHYDAHRALGFGWLAAGNRGRALDHFARTCELRRGEDREGMAARSLDHASRAKLRHDAAQFRHLAAKRRDGRRFEPLARIYEEVAGELTDGIVRLTSSQLERLGEDYNTALHLAPAAEVAGPAINPTLDIGRLLPALAAGGAGVVAIDGLLTPAALAGVRRYVLESTIWHDFSHIGGFVASYLEDGLAAPLVLQIAADLRTVLAPLLGPHPLSQAWVFKGLESAAAVEAHADDAAFSVNLWLTPDAANLEPDRGGLAVCRVPPPADWRLAGYDEDHAAVGAFLDAHVAETLNVPYAENRAVLFRSRLFHRSDAPRFAEGYDNHRINLTLLYGRHDAGLSISA